MDDAGCNAASFRKEHDCGKLERRPRANPFWPPLASRSDATMVAVGFSPRATTDLDASRRWSAETTVQASLRDARGRAGHRGLKPTATITSSLRDCQKLIRAGMAEFNPTSEME